MTEYLDDAIKCCDITIAAAENRLKNEPENAVIINLTYDLKQNKIKLATLIADIKKNNIEF